MQQSPKGTFRRWTPQEDFQLIYLMELGKDKESISKAINRGVPATSWRVSVLKNRSQMNRNLTFRTAPWAPPLTTLTLHQAASILGITYEKARNLVITGHLPGKKERIEGCGKGSGTGSSQIGWLVSEAAVLNMKLDGVPKVSATEPKVGDAKIEGAARKTAISENKSKPITLENIDILKNNVLRGMVTKIRSELKTKAVNYKTLASRAGVLFCNVQHDLKDSTKPSMTRLLKYYLILGIEN